MLVAPFVGAWVETKSFIAPLLSAGSRPSWARGLKLQDVDCAVEGLKVAPFVGAWVETPCALSSRPRPSVAPFVGAWVETMLRNIFKVDEGRALRGRVG